MDFAPRVSTEEAGIDKVEAVQTWLDNISLNRDNVLLTDSPGLNPTAVAQPGPVNVGSNGKLSVTVKELIQDPWQPIPGGKNVLDLPIDILELICRLYLDTCSNTCLGLTCKAFFNITEHLNPFQVNLYSRTLPSRKCLGHLLTDWMAPKYTFDHSWGIFRLKRHYIKNEADIERRWREKESWPRIRIFRDGMGAIVAFRAKRMGFEEMEARLPYWNRP